MIKVNINKQKLNCWFSHAINDYNNATPEQVRYIIKTLLSSDDVKIREEMLNTMCHGQDYQDPVDIKSTYERYKNNLDLFLDQFEDKYLPYLVSDIWRRYNSDLERELLFKNPEAAIRFEWDQSWSSYPLHNMLKKERAQAIKNMCTTVSNIFNIPYDVAMEFLYNFDMGWHDFIDEYNTRTKKSSNTHKADSKIIAQFKELLNSPDTTYAMNYDSNYKDVALLFLATGVDITEEEMIDIFQSYNGDVNAFLSSLTPQQLIEAYDAFLQDTSYESIARDYSLKTALDFENIILTYGKRRRGRKQIADLLGISEEDVANMLSEMLDD